MADQPPAPPKPTSGLASAHQWRLWLSGLVGSRYDGLRHFAVVEPGVLMRSGQPHVRDLDWIHATHGLRTIMAVRGGTRHPLRGRWFRKQTAWCAAHDVELVHIRMSDEHTPPAEAFDRLLKLIGDPARCPVLVHCEQGFHRTGIMVAAFRMAVSGWSWDETVAEMSHFKFEISNQKRRPLVDALRQWAVASGRA